MELGVWETPVQTHAPDALHVPALFLPGATADTLSADARLGDVIMECPAVGLGGGLWGQLVSHARMPSPPESTQTDKIQGDIFVRGGSLPVQFLWTTLHRSPLKIY